MKERIEWIDALKGMGIFLTTLGHLYPNIYIEKYIYSFHMFLFFAISGYLYKNIEQANLYRFVFRKAKILLAPFLFWDIIATGVDVLDGNGIEAIRRMFIIDGKLCWNAPIWFLLILFITEVLYVVVNIYLPYGDLFCISVPLIIWYVFGGTNMILKLNLVSIALFFFTIGSLCRKFELSGMIKLGKGVRTGVVITCLFGINIVFGVVLNGRISLTQGYFDNYYWCLWAGISGVVLHFIIFRLIPPNKFLVYLGKRTMPIMCMQYVFFRFFDYLSVKLIGISVWYSRNTIKAICVSIITIGLVILLEKIYNGLCNKYQKLQELRFILGI